MSCILVRLQRSLLESATSATVCWMFAKTSLAEILLTTINIDMQRSADTQSRHCRDQRSDHKISFDRNDATTSSRAAFTSLSSTPNKRILPYGGSRNLRTSGVADNSSDSQPGWSEFKYRPSSPEFSDIHAIVPR